MNEADFDRLIKVLYLMLEEIKSMNKNKNAYMKACNECNGSGPKFCIRCSGKGYYYVNPI